MEKNDDDEPPPPPPLCRVCLVCARHGIYRSKLLGSAAAAAAVVGSSPARVITSIDFSVRKRARRASERELRASVRA